MLQNTAKWASAFLSSAATARSATCWPRWKCRSRSARSVARRPASHSASAWRASSAAPGTAAAARAGIHVRRLREWFAEKAYKNGLFYLSRKAYDSAIMYFKDVVATYPETPRAADALLRLVDTYRTLRYEEEARETCDHLRRYYAQARGLDERCPAPAGAG